MSISVRWVDEAQTILYYEYTGPWSWPEYKEINEQAVALTAGVNHKVYVIADFRKSQLLPESALSSFRRSMKTSRFEFEFTVLIFESEFILRLLQLFRKLNQTQSQKLRTARSPEEAFALIAAHQAQNKT